MTDLAAMRDLWRGNANAWECDEMGHLNIKSYIAKSNEALSALAGAIGLSNLDDPRAASALRPRELHVRFLAEARPGAPLIIGGGFSSITQHEATACLIMRHALSNIPAAAFTLRVDHIDPHGDGNVDFDTAARAAAEALTVTPPDVAQPRSSRMGPPAGDAAMEAADARGLMEIGRGMYRTSDVDAFGRVRLESHVGRISDSVVHYFGQLRGPTQDSGVGGALLEARFIIHETPRSGDLYVIRSGVVEFMGKALRLVHWFLDPVSGRPWVTMEGISVFLDLKARKVAPPPDDMRAKIEAAMIPDLTI